MSRRGIPERQTGEGQNLLHPSGRKRIVIAEDDTDLSYLEKFLLEEEGFDVEVYADGCEALAAIEEHPPQLVLLDVKLPGMLGTEVRKRLKENDRTKNVPAIFSSALAEMGPDLKDMINQGDGWIAKPFNIDNMVGEVKRRANRNLLPQP